MYNTNTDQVSKADRTVRDTDMFEKSVVVPKFTNIALFQNDRVKTVHSPTARHTNSEVKAG